MEYKWLKEEGNNSLIVFFNGWGMDEGIIKHLVLKEQDLLMFYDYNNLNLKLNLSELNKYNKIHLIAWSMGVMIATLFDIKYDTKTAINGTLKPIDNDYGIPERIYNLTAKNFSPKGRDVFIRNMFNGENIHITNQREFSNQKSELESLMQYKSNFDFKYDKILISDNDKIIPTKNQTKFWGTSANLKGGHAPFILFNNWSELL